MTRIDSLVVVGERAAAAAFVLPVQPHQDLQDVLRRTPLALIRRGSSCVSDLYVDGFKRQDITVTVDGQRQVTACPNRMDARAGQVDLADVEEARIFRDGGTLQAGLGGRLDLRRRLPGQESAVAGMLDVETGGAQATRFHLAAEGRGLRATARHRRIEPYQDARERTFTQMYGYAQAPTATITELRADAAFLDGDARAAWETSTDVLFPYLTMDERANDHYEASCALHGHRLYFNRTEHAMDNALRQSWATTRMMTDAEISVCGVAGPFYEAYVQNWDAQNRIVPVAAPAAATASPMIPDVWRLAAAAAHAFGGDAHPWLTLRAGIAHTEAHRIQGVDLYVLHGLRTQQVCWSVPCGATLARRLDVGEAAGLTVSAEAAREAPAIEQQFITVDKPGATPDWLGNPGLEDPLRATCRVAAEARHCGAEIFGTRVWDYPDLVRVATAAGPVQTYRGADALLAGVRAWASWRFVAAAASWDWGEKIDGGAPLAEIQPLTLDLTVRAPRRGAWDASLSYRHAAGQGRIDAAQNEAPTGAWNRLDAEVSFVRDGIRLALALQNATDALYSQHLSYLRNPFAAGTRVYEPGRTMRASARFTF